MNPEPLAGFDAVAESRKWKQAVALETEGMTVEQRIAYFRGHSSLSAMRDNRHHTAPAGAVAEIEKTETL